MAIQPNDEQRSVRESSTGEILQSCTTLASIAVAFLAYLTNINPPGIVRFMVFALGLMASGASIQSLRELVSEQEGRDKSDLFKLRNSIGLLFWTMMLLVVVLIFLWVRPVSDVIARLFKALGDFFTWLAHLFEAFS